MATTGPQKEQFDYAGELFLYTGAPESGAVTVFWGEQSCTVHLSKDPPTDPNIAYPIQLKEKGEFYASFCRQSEDLGRRVLGYIQLLQNAASCFHRHETTANKNLFEKLFRSIERQTTNFDATGTKRARLNSIPLSIGHLDFITSLNLTKNEIKTLPDSIGKLNQLQVLNVSNNRLTQLPLCILDLGRLESLYVNYNQLTSFPSLERPPEGNGEPPSAPIRCLPRLSNLSLAHNSLTRLPEGLGNRSIYLLEAHKNPIRDLPRSWTQLNSRLTISLEGHKLTAEKIKAFEALLQSRRDSGYKTATFIFN